MTTSLPSTIKFHAPWHPLKHTWVGRSYSPEFYEPVKNSKVRDSLQQIARETEEDYVNLTNTLIELGVVVDRPDINQTLTITDFIDTSTGRLDYQASGSFTLIPKPPMQPRDSQLVVGEILVTTNKESKWFNDLLKKIIVKKSLTSQSEFDAPLVTVVGDRLIIDCREHPWLYDFFTKEFPEYKITPVFIGGHNDAVFSLVKPGVIVSTHHHSNYTNTLPGWEVKFIENQSWNAIPSWRTFKHSNKQKWWVPEENNNPEFSAFVDTWLTHWLGFVAESVFDVNMLQINERCILVNNYNKDMFEFFKKHSIEPIVTPFRHRFFWDGGIHCITCDLYREGIKENYDVNSR